MTASRGVNRIMTTRRRVPAATENRSARRRAEAVPGSGNVEAGDADIARPPPP